jgi:hypothetical protein
MVQIIQRTRPTVGEQLAGGLNQGYQRGAQTAEKYAQMKMEYEQAKEMAEMKRQEELAQLKQAYPILEKRFGKENADLITSFGAGGQTELLKSLLQQEEMGERYSDLLGGENPPEDIAQADINQFAQPSGAKNQSKSDLPDYTVRPKGFTRKKWQDERSGWAKKNTESLETTRDRLRGIKRDILGTKKLQKLNQSHELPEGLERFIINPKTGDPYGLAQLSGKVPTAAQEWVKEIARFGNRAKDAFGSRVTNFDLYQYMKQFPSLLNTPEGRQNILRMMEINYELDSLYDQAIQQIIDKKGAGNIPPAEVDRVARAMIKNEEERLFDEYLNIERFNDMTFMNEGLSEQRPSLGDIFGG